MSLPRSRRQQRAQFVILIAMAAVTENQTRREQRPDDAVAENAWRFMLRAFRARANRKQEGIVAASAAFE